MLGRRIEHLEEACYHLKETDIIKRAAMNGHSSVREPNRSSVYITDDKMSQLIPAAPNFLTCWFLGLWPYPKRQTVSLSHISQCPFVQPDTLIYYFIWPGRPYFLSLKMENILVEQLLRRIEDLEHLNAHLKQNIYISHNRRTTESSSRTLTEAQCFNILQSIDDPIHISNEKGCLIYRNPAWERFYGYSVAESQGKDVIELIVGPMNATIANNIKQQILNGAIHGGEFVVRNSKGERFLAYGSSKPLCDENGKIIGVIAVSGFPTPFPETSPEPKVGAPTQAAPHQPDLATKVESKTEKEELISDCKQPPMILTSKAAQMVKNGTSPPWKGSKRKGATFDSRTASSCWHWLYHNDQEHEYVLKMISCIFPKVASQPRVNNTNALGQWCSSFDKVYEIKWEDLIIRECIGRGSYGTLYHAVWYGSDVALKLFPKQQYSHEFMLSFKQEVSVMKRLRHPNILLFMGTVISPRCVCIVTEFLCRGSLFQLLHHRRRGRLHLRHHVHMALDIARGMNHLHCFLPPLIHCDLNSSILRVDENWTVKISDFSMCRPKHETKEGIGTIEWMAPEVLRNEAADEKSDVYSYGVILWEMTTKKIPWDSLTSIQVIKAVGFMNQRLDIPKDVDPQWASLIDRCLCSEPDSRPTFQDILDELRELQKNITHATHDNQNC